MLSCVTPVTKVDISAQIEGKSTTSPSHDH
jgi:hypothetical protein